MQEGMAQAEAPTPSPLVHKRTEILSEALGSLVDSIERLEHRLSSVLAPSEPGLDEAAPMEPVASPLANDLARMAILAGRTDDRVRGMIARLEV